MLLLQFIISSTQRASLKFCRKYVIKGIDQNEFLFQNYVITSLQLVYKTVNLLSFPLIYSQCTFLKEFK